MRQNKNLGITNQLRFVLCLKTYTNVCIFFLTSQRKITDLKGTNILSCTSPVSCIHFEKVDKFHLSKDTAITMHYSYLIFIMP